jgi:ligand-binding sensor domain-containing protein
MRVRRIVADRQGTLWASASCQGLLRFDQAAGRWQRVNPGQDGAVHTLARFSNGDLWVAGPDLAARSPDDGRTWSVVATAADQIGIDPTSIIEGPDGRPWIGDYGGGVSVHDGTQWRHLQRSPGR